MATKRGKSKAGKSRRLTAAGFSGPDRNAKIFGRGKSGVVDGWRSQVPYRGADLDRDGNPLAEPATNLAWLDWCNRGNPMATGIGLPEVPGNVATPQAIADSWAALDRLVTLGNAMRRHLVGVA